MGKLPYYEVHYLNVKDADAIILHYIDEKGIGYIVIIDAGNIGDSQTIKDYILTRWNTTTIDLAICTHPDSDHKGGFFDLLNDPAITIKEFWINDPEDVIDDEEYELLYPNGDRIEHCRDCYSHPQDSSSPNLVNLALEKCNKVKPVYAGCFHPRIPLQVLGPTMDFYYPLAIEMLKNQKRFQVVDNTIYQDVGIISESAIVSAIDSKPDDPSPTNAGSIILLFSPEPNKTFLLFGDANRAAIEDVLNSRNLEQCIVKIPHHGSINNLTTGIIDRLKPSCAIISAKGSKTHPSPEIVEYLSNYCKVFSTHQSKGTGMFHTPYPAKNPVEPLKDKKPLKLIPRMKK